MLLQASYFLSCTCFGMIPLMEIRVEEEPLDIHSGSGMWHAMSYQVRIVMNVMNNLKHL